MNDRALRFRIGIFVLAAGLLLAVLIVLFGSWPTLLKSHNFYFIRFDDATGIGTGTPVRLSGVRIGEVQRMMLDDDTGDVHVRIIVGKKFTVRHDQQPVLVQGILGGDTTVDFVRKEKDGKPVTDRTPVPPEEEIEGIRQAGVATLVNQAAQIVPTTQETLNEIRKSLSHFEKLTPSMDETIKEYRDLAKATREMVPELRQTNNEVQQLARSAREILPEVQKTNKEIEVTVRNWGRVGERVDVFLQTNQDKLDKVVDKFGDTLDRVATVFSDQNQKNLAATLKNVRTSSESLESLTKNTDEFVKESRQTVKRVNESVTSANEVLVNLKETTKPLAERSASVMKNLDEGTVKFNRAMDDVRELAKSFSGGSLGRILAEPELYNNINNAAIMLNHLMPRLDRILRDVEVFSDKIARHPESLGIRGAIQPSAGLKESPFTSFKKSP